ncbi:hypothetical protein TGRH88_073480 [Toxoplasma gondii]|uniref:Uncharacterized protein n=1 Tax=Toxoplasma gondii TaxID=5811 RepID=A0A7J6K2S5_TOXGO|nr:hypothetical protein TGRH88_073480 [Toxoplasma gondii]
MMPASEVCQTPSGATLRPLGTQPTATKSFETQTQAATPAFFPPAMPVAPGTNGVLGGPWAGQAMFPQMPCMPAGPLGPFTQINLPEGVDISQMHSMKETIINEAPPSEELPVLYSHSMEMQGVVPSGPLVPTNVRPPQNIVAAGLGPAEVPHMLTGSPFFHAAPSAPQCPLLSPEAPTLAYLQPIVQQKHMQKLLEEQNRQNSTFVTPQQEIQRVMNVEAQKQANGVRMMQNRVLAQEPTEGFGVITVPDRNAEKYNQMMKQMKQTLEATGQMTGSIPKGIRLYEMLQNNLPTCMSDFITSRNRHAEDAIKLCRHWRGLEPLAEKKEAAKTEEATEAGAEKEHERADSATTIRDSSVAASQASVENFEKLSVKDLCVVAAPHPSVVRQLRCEQSLQQTETVAASQPQNSPETHAAGNEVQGDSQVPLERLLHAQNQKISYLEQLLEQQRVSQFYAGYESACSEFSAYQGTRSSSAYSGSNLDTRSFSENGQDVEEKSRERAVGAGRVPNARYSKGASVKSATRAFREDSAGAANGKEADLDEVLRRFVEARSAVPLSRCLRRVQRGVYILGDLKVLVKKSHNGEILCMAQHDVSRQRSCLGENGKKFISLERFWTQMCKHLETAQ